MYVILPMAVLTSFPLDPVGDVLAFDGDLDSEISDLVVM